jgi:hypothetical protein
MKRYIAPLILCIILLCGCSDNQVSQGSTQILNADGTPAKEYSTLKEVIADSNAGENNDMPNYIDGSDTAVADVNQVSVPATYFGNKNSKIFHKSNCSSAQKTKEENRVYLSSRDEFVSKGYSPCKICNP